MKSRSPYKRSKSSMDAARPKKVLAVSEAIPADLMIEIFSRLPLKSIARCRCVSKHWDSMLSLPCFNDLFLTKSRGRPQLLFAYYKNSELLFFSSPQPRNLDVPIALNYHMKFAIDQNCGIFSPINGFFCIRATQKLTVICNPSTGQSFALPKMNKTSGYSFERRYIGYDPVKKQFKALAMTLSNHISQEHQVMTLGTRERTWTRIECDIPHYPRRNMILCINGVLYYVASPHISSSIFMIVCFDVGCEKFSSVKVPGDFADVTEPPSIFISYKGKLGSLRPGRGCRRISGGCTSMEMCILEDPRKHKWSRRVYEFPPLWKKVIGHRFLRIVGMSGTNEVVFQPRYDLSDPFYVIYYSLETKTVKRFELQGMGPVEGSNVYAFPDHLENVTTL